MASGALWRLPIDKGLGAAKRRRKALVMRQIIDNRQDGVLALDMKLRLEFALGQKHCADAPDSSAGKLGKQVRAASRAAHPLRCPYDHRRRLAPDDLHRRRGIDRRRRISRAVSGLAIAAMAIELHDRFAGDFQTDRAAAALRFDRLHPVAPRTRSTAQMST